MKRTLGLWNLSNSGFHKKLSSEEGKKIIREAIKHNFSSFDSAYSYEGAESVLSSVLKEKGLLYEVEITSKVMPVPSMERKTEIILRRLGRSYVDNLLLHWPSDSVSLFSSLKILESLMAKERTRNIGVSNFPLSLLEKVTRDFPITLHQRPLSILWSKDIIKEKELHLKTMAYAPRAMGVLTDSFLSSEGNDDKRRKLEFFNSPDFEDLLSVIKEECKNNNLKTEDLSYTFVKRLNPEYIIEGFSSPSQIKDDTLELKDDSFTRLLKSSLSFSEGLKSDNIFSHNYLRG